MKHFKITLILSCLTSFVTVINSFITDISHLYKGHEINGFLPFGTKFGDTKMLKNDDGFFGPIEFPYDLPFFKNNFTKFFINTNGLVSFEQDLANYYDILTPNLNISYISPFWTDIDTRYNGDIFHREIVDDLTKDLINNEIYEYTNENFKLNYAYLVTWLRVEPYPRYNEFVDNTFQLALISNGYSSFVFFNYHNLTWPNKIIRKNLQIGYYDPMDINSCFLFKNYDNLDFKINKTTKALKQLETESNRGKPGKWLLRIDQKDELLENSFLASLEQKPYVVAIKTTTANLNKPLNKIKNTSLTYKSERLKSFPSYVNYGSEFGDKIMPKADDGYTGPIKIPNSKFNSFYINTNGIISFDQQLSYSGEITTQQNKSRFIAPLWTDIDTRQLGEIFHKEILDKVVLSKLKQEISNFEPKWAYEITWSNVHPYIAKYKPINTNILNNAFQCIILSGENSNSTSALYVIFNYLNLTWPNRIFNKNLVVGYSVDHLNRALMKNFEYNQDFSLEYSAKKSEEIITKLLNESNCGRPGKWIFRLDYRDERLNEKFKK